MRTRIDRVRQAVLFEAFGLLLSIPLGAASFGFDLGKTGILAAIGATIATVWNYIFNLAFDHALKRRYGTTTKSLRLRLLHALSFELGLMVVFLPIIAWWMNISLIEALIVDIAFVLFYLVYAFLFTWCYDAVFPDNDAGEKNATAETQ